VPHPDERVRIGDRRLDRRLRSGSRIGRQQWQGARPRDRRRDAIEDQPIELLLGIGHSDPSGMECCPVTRSDLAPLGIPVGDSLGEQALRGKTDLELPARPC
jgi:hypothetical protein